MKAAIIALIVSYLLLQAPAQKTTGSYLSATTPPKCPLADIVFDDDRYLYVEMKCGGDPHLSSPLFRVRKDLQETDNLEAAESATLWQTMTNNRNERMAPPPPQTDRNDNIVYLNGVEVISLKPFYEKKNKYYEQHPGFRNSGDVWWRERVVAIDQDAFIVSMSIVYLDHVSDPPHEDYIFLVSDGKTIRLDAMNESIYDAANAHDRAWIWSRAPDNVNAQNSGAVGQVMWVGSDGQTRLWNDALHAQCLKALGTDGESLIVLAFRLPGEQGKGTAQGFYRLHVDGTYDKLSEPFGTQAYVDQSGTLYVQGENSISDVITNTTVSW